MLLWSEQEWLDWGVLFIVGREQPRDRTALSGDVSLLSAVLSMCTCVVKALSSLMAPVRPVCIMLVTSLIPALLCPCIFCERHPYLHFIDGKIKAQKEKVLTQSFIARNWKNSDSGLHLSASRTHNLSAIREPLAWRFRQKQLSGREIKNPGNMLGLLLKY